VILISTTRYGYCARVCVGRLVVEEGLDEEKVQGAGVLRDSPLETERKHLCEEG